MTSAKHAELQGPALDVGVVELVVELVELAAPQREAPRHGLEQPLAAWRSASES